jgi:hypothetical protein
MRNTRLVPVGETEEISETPAPEEKPSVVSHALTSMFLLTMKTLSQKTVIALASLTDLLMIASAFVLWVRILDQPTALQLGGVGMYGIFILITVFVRNRG